MRAWPWITIALAACSRGFEPVDDSGDASEDASESESEVPDTESEVPEETDTPVDTSPPDLDVYPTCASATGAAPTAPGQYEGTVAGWGAELAPVCAGEPAGPDAVVPVRVPAGQLLAVEYTLAENTGVTWLSGECAADSCEQLYYAAEIGGTGALLWKNDGNAPRDWSVILDAEEATVPANTPWTLDVRMAAPVATTPADTCGAAGALAPSEPGFYTFDLTAFTNNVGLDWGTCGFPWDMPAREGILRVLLEPNETLTAIMESGDVDASMYLIRNCATTNTCVATADEWVGGYAERLHFQNTGSSSAAYYLVVDGWDEDDAPGRINLVLDIR